MNNLTSDQINKELIKALQEVRQIDAKLDEFELTKNKLILQEVMNSMKRFTQQLRTISQNPNSRTKENAPLFQDLSNNMKDLASRTRSVAAANSLPSSAPATIQRSDRQEDAKPLSPKNLSPTLFLEQIPLRCTPLKGILKKQGKKGAWKLRCCFEDGNKLCFCHPEEDLERVESSTDFIIVNDIKEIVRVSNVEFHIVSESGKITQLQVTTELNKWLDAIELILKNTKRRSNNDNTETTLADSNEPADENQNQNNVSENKEKTETLHNAEPTSSSELISETSPSSRPMEHDLELSQKVLQLEHALQKESTTSELALKLEAELRLKEKQYELLRGQQKIDQEARKIAEQKIELLKAEMNQKDQESKAKDQTIRKLNKKLKENRKDWISNPNSTQSSVSNFATITSQDSHHNSTILELSTTIDLKNREIKGLKEAIWAHQEQNSLLAKEFARIQQESIAALKVKDDMIHRLEKELTFVKNTYQDMRQKYTMQQLGLLNPEDKSLLAEVQQLKKAYFFSVALSCKLSQDYSDCNLNVMELFEQALVDNIDWKSWMEWIPEQFQSFKNKK